VQAFEPVAAASAEAGEARLRDRGVYVVTGGLGGVGLALAGVLAEKVCARLVLVGRTVFPGREAWDTIVTSGREAALAARIEGVRALEAAGAEVLIVAADVASEEDVARTVTQTRARFGDIHGVVHAAGVGGDGIIALKSRADAERVLRPKVAGTRQLLRALDGVPLDFVVLCSSLTSVLGGVGQADYGAANAFLDSCAQADWCAGEGRVVSINWDTWSGVGMAVGGSVPASFADRKAQAIESGISVAEGRDVLLRALGLRLPQVAVCTKDLGLFMAALTVAPAAGAAPSAARERSGVRHPRPSLATPYVAPQVEPERIVCEVFEQALGVSSIGVHDSFFELGGHSLLAVDVMSQLNRQFGTSVPVAALYEGLTPGAVARRFVPALEAQPMRGTVDADRRRDRGRRHVGASKRRGSRMERRPRHES
jgi:NAD(P)-dependent dehydrogenase (short-subunit alcohol dehydrogenase family)